MIAPDANTQARTMDVLLAVPFMGAVARCEIAAAVAVPSNALTNVTGRGGQVEANRAVARVNGRTTSVAIATGVTSEFLHRRSDALRSSESVAVALGNVAKYISANAAPTMIDAAPVFSADTNERRSRR